MELRGRVTGAGIVILTNIGASLGISPELGGAQVASQLGGGGVTGGELEEGVFWRGVAQVPVLIAEIGLESGTAAT